MGTNSSKSTSSGAKAKPKIIKKIKVRALTSEQVALLTREDANKITPQCATFIIDVRRKQEFDVLHIDGAIQVDPRSNVAAVLNAMKEEAKRKREAKMKTIPQVQATTQSSPTPQQSTPNPTTTPQVTAETTSQATTTTNPVANGNISPSSSSSISPSSSSSTPSISPAPSTSSSIMVSPIGVDREPDVLNIVFCDSTGKDSIKLAQKVLQEVGTTLTDEHRTYKVEIRAIEGHLANWAAEGRPLVNMGKIVSGDESWKLFCRLYKYKVEERTRVLSNPPQNNSCNS